ncbi:MAG TPA: dTDP-glucose 4,6-dehydratase [Stellaceae bacterium]|nr:dTDP-glucose 4,6-dehydratase [Stellaceae bacterium]
MRILVTGGAGFIGSAVIRHIVAETSHEAVVLDKFTYAASLDLQGLSSPRLRVRRADICETAAVAEIIAADDPDAIMHLAAETHVDRSIDGPAGFVAANVVGTQILLDAALRHWRGLEAGRKASFRFHHISTDEVFGSLGAAGYFTEDTRYDPRSPYSATKAASDHLVRAWHHTYGLPVVLSNCSNNYGPWQFPEKLIPLTVTHALAGKPLPIYGKGENVRDWLHVDDHARALIDILTRGRVGESYNVGCRNERSNIDVVRSICRTLDELAPRADGKRHDSAITFVPDRPGHDLRYAIDPAKIEHELGWRARETFEGGLAKTVAWYVANGAWCAAMRERYDGGRLGLATAAS